LSLFVESCFDGLWFRCFLLGGDGVGGGGGDCMIYGRFLERPLRGGAGFLTEISDVTRDN